MLKHKISTSATEQSPTKEQCCRGSKTSQEERKTDVAYKAVTQRSYCQDPKETPKSSKQDLHIQSRLSPLSNHLKHLCGQWRP